MHHGGFPVCHFVRNYTHNSISKGGIRGVYLSNDCSTIEDIYSLVRAYVRYDQRVMSPNTEHNYFLMQHFVHTYTRNSITTGRMLMFYISSDCSTIRDVYFLC